MWHTCLLNAPQSHLICSIGWFNLVIGLHHHVSLKRFYDLTMCIFQNVFSIENIILLQNTCTVKPIIVMVWLSKVTWSLHIIAICLLLFFSVVFLVIHTTYSHNYHFSKVMCHSRHFNLEYIVPAQTMSMVIFMSDRQHYNDIISMLCAWEPSLFTYMISTKMTCLAYSLWSLTLIVPMEFPIRFDTVKSG